MKAIDFSIENGVTGMKMNALLECVENAKSRGDDVKAQMIVRRLNELKKYDELKIKQSSSYKPLLQAEWEL